MRGGLVGFCRPRRLAAAAAVDDDFVVLRGRHGGHGGVEGGGGRGRVGAHLPLLHFRGPSPLWGLQRECSFNTQICPLDNFLVTS